MTHVQHHGRRQAEARPTRPRAHYGPAPEEQVGFTLVELLIAAAISTLVLGAIFSLLDPAHGPFQAQPEVSDMQQRLRVGVESLYGDLLMAGAGLYSGASSGPLHRFFAPVLPYRIGTRSADPPHGVFFRPDAVSVIHVPTTAAQCAIREPMATVWSDLTVDARPGCPVNDAACGFSAPMRAAIFDGTGTHDLFTITAVDSRAGRLQHRPESFSKAYGAEAYLAHVRVHTYWLKTDPPAETYQLMRYDGDRSDVPVVDDVVGLTFEYFGDPMPPMLRRPLTDPDGPWTTYGPKPPPLDVDVAGDGWPAGQNCAFTVDSGTGLHAPRLAVLGPPSGPLVALNRGMLSDGPWCPDAASTNRHDADLLRIRKVRVSLRVQAAASRLRGPVGALFARGGSSPGGSRFVPDQEVHFEVVPRNLNLDR